MSTPPSRDYYVRLGRRMRSLREAAGLSQAALGARLGRSPSAIDRYEMGQRRIPLSDLVRMAAALDAPLGALLDQPRGGRRDRPAGAREIRAEHRRLLRALDRRLAYPSALPEGGRVAETAARYRVAVAALSEARLRAWAARAGLPGTAGSAELRRYAELVVRGVADPRR